jgi:hypothetical protein
MTFRAEYQVSFQMTVKTDTTVDQQAGCPGNLHIFVSLLFTHPFEKKQDFRNCYIKLLYMTDLQTPVEASTQLH